jgi:G3E family GTPase
VHEIGEQLEVAVHVLQSKSDMVTDAARKRLDSALTQLDKSIDGLHHAAEENDAAQATLELGKIKGLLPLIESQYPAGALR